MKTMPAAKAKNKFGALIDTAQREPVAISKRGRTVAIVVPVHEYEEYKDLKLELLRKKLKKGLDQIERGEVSDGEAIFDQIEKELDD